MTSSQRHVSAKCQVVFEVASGTNWEVTGHQILLTRETNLSLISNYTLRHLISVIQQQADTDDDESMTHQRNR